MRQVPTSSRIVPANGRSGIGQLMPFSEGVSSREVENLRRLASADPDRALGEDMLRYPRDPTN